MCGWMCAFSVISACSSLKCVYRIATVATIIEGYAGCSELPDNLKVTIGTFSMHFNISLCRCCFVQWP